MKDGTAHTLTCDILAGCDGFHGVCRPAVPAGALTTYDHIFPFGWLGILSESPPIREMTYANHDRGFALCSRRSMKISRHYVQVAPDEDVSRHGLSRSAAQSGLSTPAGHTVAGS